jgi:hypothetical protein
MIVWWRWWRWVGIGLMLSKAQQWLLPLLLLGRMSTVYFNSMSLACSLLMCCL